VLVESLVLSMASAAIGVGLAAVVLPLATGSQAMSASGLGAMHVQNIVFVAAMGVAVLLALVSGIPPALRARRLNIVAALSGR
jgi:putative ABC transport system permease protein